MLTWINSQRVKMRKFMLMIHLRWTGLNTSLSTRRRPILTMAVTGPHTTWATPMEKMVTFLHSFCVFILSHFGSQVIVQSCHGVESKCEIKVEQKQHIRQHITPGGCVQQQLQGSGPWNHTGIVGASFQKEVQEKEKCRKTRGPPTLPVQKKVVTWI